MIMLMFPGLAVPVGPWSQYGVYVSASAMAGGNALIQNNRCVSRLTANASLIAGISGTLKAVIVNGEGRV